MISRFQPLSEREWNSKKYIEINESGPPGPLLVSRIVMIDYLG
jgi:hypothetical protein